MASYCTPADLVNRYTEVELLQLAPGVGGALDTAKVQRAIDDVSGLIDGYLRPRHALPLTAVPQLLVRLASAMARYELHMGGDRQPTDQVIKDRNDAIAFLKDVAASRADLGITPAGEEPADTQRTIHSGVGVQGVTNDALDAYRGRSSGW